MKDERHDENVENAVVRFDENIEMVVILEMEKEIVMEDGGYVWMAPNVPMAPPPAVAVAAVFVVTGGCVPPPSILSFAALK